jgi:hypothetical protein
MPRKQISYKISNEIQIYLNEVADLAASKAVQKKRVVKSTVDYYKLTEKVLYQYNDLKSYIEDEEWYILNYLSETKPGRSKDIVIFSSRKSESVVECAEAMRQKAKDSLELTRQFMARIDKALERLEPEQIDIINAMLFEKKENAINIAERIHCDTATLYRKKKKAIEKISLFLFGALVINI